MIVSDVDIQELATVMTSSPGPISRDFNDIYIASVPFAQLIQCLTPYNSAYSMQELNELNKLAEENKLVYMLDCLYIFSDSIQKIKQLIDNDIKGKIKFVHFKRIGDELRRKNAGIARIDETMFKNNVDILDDLFFHDAGILFYLFNNKFEIESVEKLNLFHESLIDTAFLNLHGDPKIKIDLSWTLTPRARMITIYCDDRIIEYDAFCDDSAIDIHYLSTMGKEKKYYNVDMPLTSMLKYFINTINSDYLTEYIGNFHLMSKITELRNSI